MSYRIPGVHPAQKPSRNPQIDWRHPLSRQLVGAWLIPNVLRPVGDGADAWHYRIANGVDDNYARVEGTNSFSAGPRGAVLNFYAGMTPGSAAWIPNAPALNYSQSMSLFCRARIPALGSFRWLVSKVGGSWLGIDPSNKLTFTSLAGFDHTSSATVGDGGWHTVGMTMVGQTLQLYVDGAADNSFGGLSLTILSADTFWGHRGDWIEFFNGDIEWVYQWKRPLNAAEVIDLQANPFGLYQTESLGRYYSFPPPAVPVLVVSAVLVEDGDGILPSGNVSADPTPTLSWTAPTGAVGPFLYSWRLRAGSSQLSGAVVASGSLYSQTFVQVRPAQPAGPYTFELNVRDGNGASGAVTYYGFTLIDRRRLKAPRLISLPAFDLAPVVPDPPEYLRYLPQWLSCFGTATAPPSGSLLYRVMLPVIRQIQGAASAGQDLLDSAGLGSVPLNAPRLAWHLRTTLRPADPVTFLAQASGDVRPIRRAASMKQFLDADDPVCLIGETGHVVFRNLAQRQVTLSPVSGSTGATGSALATLSSQYQIPDEGAGMVPDANVLFQSAAGTPGGGAWYRIRGGSAAIDPAYATLQLSAGLSGSITFQYQSQTVASALQVAVSGQPWRTPGEIDLWNRFDEIALLADMRRRNAEDNVSLARRLTVRLLTPPGTDPQATAMAIAAELQLVDLLPWDGQSILDLAGSGYISVRGVTVPGLRATDQRQERLVANGAALWTGGKRAWLPGWQVLVDGRPAGPASYPGMTVSGNTLNFGSPVSGVITAHYQYANYRFDLSSQQAITRVVPTSGNVPSGDYRVLLNQGVQLSQPADPDVQNRKLLNADGTPNALFFLLQQTLLNDSPIHVARARWGGDAYWTPPADDQPLVDRLPALFDRFTP